MSLAADVKAERKIEVIRRLQAAIKANDLDSMDELAEIKLPYMEEQPYPYPVPMMEEGMMVK